MVALQKSVIADLESGKHPRDNKLLQQLEGKLGIWLTGNPERLGEPKTKVKKAEQLKATPRKAGSGKEKKVGKKQEVEEQLPKEEKSQGTDSRAVEC